QSVASQSNQQGRARDILALHSYDIIALRLHLNDTEDPLSDVTYSSISRSYRIYSRGGTEGSAS
ncbi:MAG: hypothetical protein ACRYFU_12375, partial [Janthinobacterium lividum]